MKVFIDWSIKKGFVLLRNGNEIETVQELNFEPKTEIYIESGCPKFLLYNLIEKGMKIFISQSKETAHLRDELKITKTDENDVKVLQLLFKKDPSLFVEMSNPDINKIRLKYIMGKYEVLTIAIAGFKNRAHYAEKEFGKFDFLQTHIKDFELEKIKLVKTTELLLANEIKIIQIRGISTTLIARLLAQAYPHDFPTLSRWLAYCGYKGYMKKRNEKGKGKRPNFVAKMILHIMATQMLKFNNPIYRPLYDRCKLRYQTEHPEWAEKKATKGQAHRKAMNIVATYIAKEFWFKLHEIQSTDGVEFKTQDLWHNTQKSLIQTYGEN